MKELQLRSFVVHYLYNCSTVIGISTERYNSKGYSLDFSYTYLPVLTEEMKVKAKEIVNKLGYFKNPTEQKIH